MDTGVGAGVYSGHLNLSSWTRMESHATVFQAEIQAIKMAAELVKGSSGERLAICVDSRAAILALAANRTVSRLVEDCRNAVNEIAAENTVTIVWVPGHSDIEGNEEADALARRGSETVNATALSTRRSMASVQELIDKKLWRVIDREWGKKTDCRVARIFWPTVDIPRSRRLMKFGRKKMVTAAKIITGHCLTGVHAARLNLTDNERCRRCDWREDTFTHLICECPALDSLRHRYTGFTRFSNLETASRVDLLDLIRFYDAAGPEVV